MRNNSGFLLVELMVGIAVYLLVVFYVTQYLDSFFIQKAALLDRLFFEKEVIRLLHDSEFRLTRLEALAKSAASYATVREISMISHECHAIEFLSKDKRWLMRACVRD